MASLDLPPGFGTLTPAVAQHEDQAAADPTPDDRALFDQLAEAVRKHKARERAAIQAQAYRQAADDIDAEYPGPDVDRAARHAAAFLRRRADQIHPAEEPTP
ncbi:hypothetical protein NGM36_13185 [Streptomyces mutabilis]|uniref:hypothetical protein n=1 Tax=Streptomyces mutabilis TaxID=67332 RepID=UPI0022BA6CA7|nr:hypothetical protein [Streptomyces mutabilis]MCZ9350741.1 hypothetical protein [Streptomyces mutabilis]